MRTFDYRHVIAVTNRSLCGTGFIERLEMLAGLPLKAIVLREKDLSEDEYTELGKITLDIFRGSRTTVIFHTYINAALALGVGSIQLPLALLRETPRTAIQKFTAVGASAHSIMEAEEAQALGTSYVSAGHIFATECKKGLAPRGLDLITDIKSRINIPVYAIGGINFDNAETVLEKGCDGVCMMSAMMKGPLPEII